MAQLKAVGIAFDTVSLAHNEVAVILETQERLGKEEADKVVRACNAYDIMMKTLDEMKRRYKPGGTRRHCWLCNGNGAHFPGCIYPVVCDTIEKATK